ncbi:hypothetical protein KI387_031553, partial [Taxus chinensis]
ARKIAAGAFLHLEQETLCSQVHGATVDKAAVAEAQEGDPTIQDAVQNVLLALTMHEEAFVENAFSGSKSEEVLAMHKSSGIAITRQCFQCLKPMGKLNDEVINLYLELLKEREEREPLKSLKCHFFNTFFYVKLAEGPTYDYEGAKKWAKSCKLGYDVFDCDSIFVPIHKPNHWCLAIINIKEKKIQYLDSLHGRDPDNYVLNVLARYIKDDGKDNCREDMGLSKWQREHVKNLPRQMNDYDCGMFMLKYADYLSRGIPISFTQ